MTLCAVSHQCQPSGINNSTRKFFSHHEGCGGCGPFLNVKILMNIKLICFDSNDRNQVHDHDKYVYIFLYKNITNYLMRVNAKKVKNLHKSYLSSQQIVQSKTVLFLHVEKKSSARKISTLLSRDAGSYSGQRVQFVNKRAYFFQKGHASF